MFKNIAGFAASAVGCPYAAALVKLAVALGADLPLLALYTGTRIGNTVEPILDVAVVAVAFRLVVFGDAFAVTAAVNAVARPLLTGISAGIPVRSRISSVLTDAGRIIVFELFDVSGFAVAVKSALVAASAAVTAAVSRSLRALAVAAAVDQIARRHAVVVLRIAFLCSAAVFIFVASAGLRSAFAVYALLPVVTFDTVAGFAAFNSAVRRESDRNKTLFAFADRMSGTVVAYTVTAAVDAVTRRSVVFRFAA
jgi:hypothetical protein